MTTMAESSTGNNSSNTKWMKKMNEIATALVKAQKAFAPAFKTSTNPHFKSTYADLAACIEAVIDALNENGVFLNQHTSESDSGVTVETVFTHESGETLHCGKLHVPASKHDPQGYGSALTYARRYSLMAACGIAPEDDDGEAASRDTASRKPEKQKLTESAVIDFLTTINEADSLDALRKAFQTAYRAAEHVSDTAASGRFEKAKDARKTFLQNDVTSQA